MPDRDNITLGEVYRAVLSLKEEFAVTRKEISESHNKLQEDLKNQSMTLVEAKVEIQVLKARVKSLEEAPTKNSDPTARIAAAAGTGIAGLLSWWMSQGG